MGPSVDAVALIERWYRAALAAVDPAVAVRRYLGREGDEFVVDGVAIPVGGCVCLLAVGKAAVGMAEGALGVGGDLIDEGIVVTKDGHARGALAERIAVFEASHPVPDERGVAATRRALAMVERLGRGDVLLALLSGGGSALFEAPRPPVTLAEVAATTDLLLRAGAPIQDLNLVRRRLSLVKGGGLLRAAGPATVATLILSDVLGNDPAVIASGPTVDDAGGAGADALPVVDRYGVRDRVPAAVVDLLAERERPASVGNGGARAMPPVVVADNGTAVAAVARAATASGLVAETVWAERQGEAADAGRAWVAACRGAPADVDVLLGGGETTVTVRGAGVGGRNTEFALAAALALADVPDAGWVVASLATDGQDALTGVAGAVADGGTVARAATAGVDARRALADNDSLRVFEVAGGLIRPGPTGTNVNDLYVALRVRSK